MLHSITSSLPNFATVTFKEGMNFIVAEGDRSKRSKGKSNSVGKSSIFFLIDYLLGGNVSKTEFDDDRFAGATFTLDATLAGSRVTVTRAADSNERGFILLRGDASVWSVLNEKQITAAKSKDGLKIKIAEWRKILGVILFDLPEVVPGNVAKKATPPSARELFGFLNRKHFLHVAKSFATQGEEKGTLACTYLMGINWNYISILLGLKNEDKIVKSIESTADFELEALKHTKANVLKKMSELEKKVSKAEKELAEFKAKDSIALFLGQTDDVTEQLRLAQQKALNASRRIALAKRSLEGLDESPDELVAFYDAAKKELGPVVKATLKDACDFHNKVRANRFGILKKEIAFQEEELKKANEAIEQLDAQRELCIKSDLIRDSFADFNEKQTQLSALRKQLTEIQQAQKLREDAAREKARLQKIKSNLAVSEKEVFETFKEDLDNLAATFASTMLRIYGEGIKPKFEALFYDGETSLGKQKPFTIKLQVSVQGDKGPGIAHMKICIFDYLLFGLCHKQDFRIDFLLHDSPAFESTDANQFPSVMTIANEMVQSTKGQYICAIDRHRFSVACQNDKGFKTIVDSSHQISLSETHKLYGFDY